MSVAALAVLAGVLPLLYPDFDDPLRQAMLRRLQELGFITPELRTRAESLGIFTALRPVGSGCEDPAVQALPAEPATARRPHRSDADAPASDSAVSGGASMRRTAGYEIAPATPMSVIGSPSGTPRSSASAPTPPGSSP
mgnify:CR=1 FL=1